MVDIEPFENRRHQRCRDRDGGPVRSRESEGGASCARRNECGADRRGQKGRGDAIGDPWCQRRGEDKHREGQAIGNRYGAGDQAGKAIPGKRRELARYRMDFGFGGVIDGHAGELEAALRRLLRLGVDLGAELLQEIDGGVGDGRARAEDRFGAGRVELGIVLGRDHAADHHHDVTTAQRFQRLAQCRHQRQVPSGERRHADDVHVILHCLTGGFRGRLE